MQAHELRFKLLNVPNDMDAVEACQAVGLAVVAGETTPKKGAKKDDAKKEDGNG